MKIPNNIFLYKKDSFAIVLAKDNYSGAAIQVVRYMEQMQVDDKGIVRSAGVRPHMCWQRYVMAYTNTPTHNEFAIPVDPKLFRDSVVEAVKQAQQALAKLIEGERTIDGVLNDFYSSNQALNETEKK